MSEELSAYGAEVRRQIKERRLLILMIGPWSVEMVTDPVSGDVDFTSLQLSCNEAPMTRASLDELRLLHALVGTVLERADEQGE